MHILKADSSNQRVFGYSDVGEGGAHHLSRRQPEKPSFHLRRREKNLKKVHKKG